MGVMLDTIGQLIAGYLQKEVPGYEPFTPSDPEHLRGVIEPGDVLLVEGNNRISGIIKYLTQSTWSHGALYVGPVDGACEPDGEPLAEPGEATGDPGTKTASLKTTILGQGIALESVDDLGGALGTSSGGCIRLLNGLTPAMEFTTLVHEYAHLCGVENYVAFASGCA